MLKFWAVSSNLTEIYLKRDLYKTIFNKTIPKNDPEWLKCETQKKYCNDEFYTDVPSISD